MAEFCEVMKQRERMCESYGLNCNDCGLCSRNNEKKEQCEIFTVHHPQEAEKIIMDWTKEHPFQTNADKFREVFGIGVGDGVYKCNLFECSNSDCAECEYRGFWDREYVEPKKGE